MLHAQPLLGSNTGEALCRECNAMLSKWNIEKGQVHVILRDNASKMAKAMAQGDFEHLGCFAYTLQLVIHDGIFAQKSVIDTLCCLLTNSGALQAFTTCL